MKKLFWNFAGPMLCRATEIDDLANSPVPGGVVVEADLNLSDIATANATTLRHGFLPKLNGDPAYVLNGLGNWILGVGVGAVSDNDIPLFLSGTMETSGLRQSGGGIVCDLEFKPALVGNSKLVRTDASGNLQDVTIGAGLSFNGTTLAATGSGGNVTTSGLTGTAGPNYRVAVFTDAGNIEGIDAADFYWDSALNTLNVTNIAIGTGTAANLTVSNLQITTGRIDGATYLPTRVAVSNCNTSSTTAFNARFLRVGNIVEVTARVEMFATGGTISFRLTLPEASALASIDQLSGLALLHVTSGPDVVGRVEADVATGQAKLTLYNCAVANVNVATVKFSYQIV